MRAAYLFHLARLCGRGPDQVDALDLTDFANYIDSIDAWIKVELKLATEVSLFG